MTDQHPADATACSSRMASTTTFFGTVSAGHVECIRCARRVAPRTESTVIMAPPAFIAGRCPERIGVEQ